MAKIVLYLHARQDQCDALIEGAKKLASHPFLKKSVLQLAVMTPRSSDLLAVPPDSDFIAHLDVVLEIVFPVGCALKGLQPELSEALTPVLDLANREHSHVVLGYHRTMGHIGAFRRPPVPPVTLQREVVGLHVADAVH